MLTRVKEIEQRRVEEEERKSGGAPLPSERPPARFSESEKSFFLH